MKSRERPGRLCILIVDHNHRRPWVGTRKAPKDFHGNIGVMTAQIAKQKHENPGSFDLGAQICECIVASFLGTECTQRKF